MTASGNGDGATTGLVRTRYFARQVVTAADLTADQDYLRARARLHNRFLHGCGVVCGLEVTAEPADGDGTPAVRVTPGYALSPEGDEISVPAAHTLTVDHAAGPDECVGEGAGGDARRYLALAYREERACAVPGAPDACAGGVACDHARVRVGYRFAWLEEAPHGCAPPALDCAAALRDLLGLSVTGPTPGSALFACPPAPQDPYVVLAAVDCDDGVVTVDYGPRAVTLPTPVLTGLVRCLAGAAPAPRITDISPAEAPTGTAIDAVIAGQGLAGASAVRFDGEGVTAAIVAGGSDTIVPLRISVAQDAAPGARTFTVVTPAGAVSSGDVTFTVRRPAPQITGITPNEAEAGTVVTATITGQGLAGATAVTFSGTGVTAAVLPGGTDQALPVRITVAEDAEGTRTVTVTVAGEAVQNPAVTFSVRLPPPGITTIFPNSARAGTVLESVEITGRGLAGATAVRFSGAGVSALVQFVSNLLVRARLTIADNAAPGARTFSVDTPRGAVDSGSVVFTVQPPLPRISSIAPTEGLAGQTVDAIITGTGLTGASSVGFSGTGVTATLRGTPTAARVEVRVAVAASATAGPRTFSLTTPAGSVSSGAVTFTVRRPARISGITPPVVVRNTTVNGAISGEGLAGATSVTFSPSGGVTATVLPGVTDARVPVRIVAARTAAQGLRTFVVQTPRGPVNSGPAGVTLEVVVVDIPITREPFPRTRDIDVPIPHPLAVPEPVFDPADFPGRTVDEVPGIGPARRARLAAAGVTHLAHLASAEPGRLAGTLGVSEVRAMAFIDQARRRLQEPQA